MKPFEKQSPSQRRTKAHTAVAKAIRKGVLVRPKSCEECGAKHANIDGAHHDYRKPLDVRWLCRRCHQRWDRRIPKNSGAVGWTTHKNRMGAVAFIRVDEKTRKQLQKEAELARRKLSDYLRILIDTHPARQKKPN